MDKRKKQISPERKGIYYTGMILSGIGLLMFLSTFVTFLANFGDFSNFEARAKSAGFRAFGGMALIMIGGVLAKIGSHGLAGTGIVLDPEKARQDVEPWSRMSGGIVQDALSEVDLVNKLEDRLEGPDHVVKVRCRECKSLNDETAKFCNQCGSGL
jgi:hypothetical protein